MSNLRRDIAEWRTSMRGRDWEAIGLSLVECAAVLALIVYLVYALAARLS